jgi:AraC family transcriptional regulator
MPNIPENTPIELIDFAASASLPRRIAIVDWLTYGTVAIGRYLLKPNPGSVIGTSQYTVAVHEGVSFEMEWRHLDGAAIEARLMQPNDIQIHPCNTLVYKRWQTSSRVLFMAIDRTFTNQILGEVFVRRPIDLMPRIGIRDPVIEGMAEVWRGELNERGGGGRILAEALATALIVHLFRTYGEGGDNIHITTGGMNGARLRKVFEYIEEHLSEDISLCALAAIAGFSVHHFGEIFKAETGLAPHHFLIERRIHRAKELLLGGNTPIAQIAVEVGFSGQSHFTEHFRRLTGSTPLRFRLGRR